MEAVEAAVIAAAVIAAAAVVVEEVEEVAEATEVAEVVEEAVEVVEAVAPEASRLAEPYARVPWWRKRRVRRSAKRQLGLRLASRDNSRDVVCAVPGFAPPAPGQADRRALRCLVTPTPRRRKPRVHTIHLQATATVRTTRTRARRPERVAADTREGGLQQSKRTTPRYCLACVRLSTRRARMARRLSMYKLANAHFVFRKRVNGVVATLWLTCNWQL